MNDLKLIVNLLVLLNVVVGAAAILFPGIGIRFAQWLFRVVGKEELFREELFTRSTVRSMGFLNLAFAGVIRLVARAAGIV